jgi:hypothetical protein
MTHRRSEDEERLAAALRANLARRKSQARKRQEGEPSQRHEGEPGEPQEGESRQPQEGRAPARRATQLRPAEGAPEPGSSARPEARNPTIPPDLSGTSRYGKRQRDTPAVCPDLRHMPSAGAGEPPTRLRRLRRCPVTD